MLNQSAIKNARPCEDAHLVYNVENYASFVFDVFAGFFMIA